MDARLRLLGLVLAATPILVMAQGQSKATKPNCDAFVYNQKFLEKYPKAAAACQEVTTKNGEQWVRFSGTVTAVKGDEVTTTIVDDFNNPLPGHLTIKAPSDQKVTVDGKETKGWSNLTKGDKLDLWMPQSVIGFYAQPGALDKGKLTVTKGL